MRGTRAARGAGEVPGLRAAAGDVHTVGIAGVDGYPADPALGAEQDAGRGEDLLVVLDPEALGDTRIRSQGAGQSCHPATQDARRVGPGLRSDRQPLEPGEVLEGLLRSLGLAAPEIPANHEAQGRLYRTLLAGRRLLVLLDNAASAEQVRPLLPGSPSCCVVVTSRNRLGDLVIRDGAHTLPLDLLRPAEAHTLLSEVLGADRLSAEPLAADELIRLCGSLPLALRVAAARPAGDPGLRLADLVTEMSEGNRLEALRPDDDDNSPLRTASSASYRVLAPAARRLFRLLGPFPCPRSGVRAVTPSTKPRARSRLSGQR
ncbi:NB-ARC domain-containing protein [Streptomyces sp. NBC_01450]|uniref:NB-ARC domain-containing protein n=1 Tax=Streptomyces sp. NBC_01450 TaxID=2903871 RepID=UPI002E33ED76|nr:NB-ARC domain-containing protein [Streptomyces sp. NBC_01450]